MKVDINTFKAVSTPPAVPYQTTLHVRDHCLCLASQRASRALAKRFDRALRPLDLTSGQFSLMMSLNRPEPPTIGSVASLLAMDRTTLTANLKPLQRRGWVAAEVDPVDRRGRRLSLTEAGHAVLAAAAPIWRDTHAEVDALFSQAEAESLRDALRALA